MDENIDKKIELKDKLHSVFQENKRKLLFVLLIFIISIASFFFLKSINIKKNDVISEKYIEAGILLSSKENEKSKKLYEEIILSKNKFYSILALNTIVEKELLKDKEKILEYFDIVKKSIKTQEEKDLLSIKKALYLIKYSETEKGNQILQKLIDSDTKFKNLVKEILGD